MLVRQDWTGNTGGGNSRRYIPVILVLDNTYVICAALPQFVSRLHIDTELSAHKAWRNYRNDPKFSDRQVWSNSADLDQKGQSDQDLLCLQFPLHQLDALP